MGSSANEKLKISFIPYLSYGHMIPMVEAARIFAKQCADVTIIITPTNASSFKKTIDRDSNSGHLIRFHILQWDSEEVGLPPGVENFSTASRADFLKIFQAFEMLKPQIEQILEDTPPDCIISDMFYPWTNDTAAKLGIPRLTFRGSSYFALCAANSIEIHKPHEQVKSDFETFPLPGLPDFIEISRSQIPGWSTTHSPLSDYMKMIDEAEEKCYGMLMNSFYDLEGAYEETHKKVTGIKSWSIGPVSLFFNKDESEKTSRGKNSSIKTDKLLEWLDKKDPNSVLYFSFGSMVRFKSAQISEIAQALESSGHNFIWVVRKSDTNEDGKEDEGFPEGFESRIKESEKGLIIRGWAPQIMIMEHPAVGGIVTHCGWNSILEGVTAGLPMITWPLFAEQFYNEKLLTDVHKIGVAVGSKKWFNLGEEGTVVLEKEKIEKAVCFLMGGGDEAVEMRKRVRELRDAANRAVNDGGSSELNLVSLFNELQTMKLNRLNNGSVNV